METYEYAIKVKVQANNHPESETSVRDHLISEGIELTDLNLLSVSDNTGDLDLKPRVSLGKGQRGIDPPAGAKITVIQDGLFFGRWIAIGEKGTIVLSYPLSNRYFVRMDKDNIKFSLAGEEFSVDPIEGALHGHRS